GGRITPEHPVVLLVLDEFPLTSLLDSGGRIDAPLYPNFPKLAGHSPCYPNRTAVSGLTNWAMPAMLSGRYPTAGPGGCLADGRPVPRQPVHPARRVLPDRAVPGRQPALPDQDLQGHQGLE